jgi:hypothetical protein
MDSQISWQSAYEGGKVVSHLYPPPPRKYSWYPFLLESWVDQRLHNGENLSNRKHIFCESQLHVSDTSSYPSSGSTHNYRVNVYSMIMTTVRWPKHVDVMCKIYVVYLSVSILFNLERRRMPYLKEGPRISEVQFNNASVQFFFVD